MKVNRSSAADIEVTLESPLLEYATVKYTLRNNKTVPVNFKAVLVHSGNV